MKKNFFWLSSLIFILTVSNCQNDEMENIQLNSTENVLYSSNSVNGIDLSCENFGEIHNEIFAEYYELYDEDDTDDLILLAQRGNSILVDLYPGNFSHVNNELLEDFILSICGTTNLNEFNWRDHSLSILESSFETGQISNDFRITFANIISNGGTYNQIISTLDNYQQYLDSQPSSEMKTLENELLCAFRSVYISSDQYWLQDSSLTASNQSRCDPQDQIDVADATGGFVVGLVGTLGGPVASLGGSILGGYLFSKAVRVQIKRNGGRCI